MERPSDPAAAVILLALDTSTPLASVALSVDGVLRAREERVTTFSERLLPMIDALFAEAEVAPRQLGGVICAAGPGSFTGLRIGLSTAKGLCLGTGAPLVLVPSLAALAALGPASSTVIAAIDAFRGEIYAGLFDLDEDRMPRPRSPDLSAFALRPEALAAHLPADRRPTFYVGDGFAKHPVAIPAGARALPAASVAAELLRLGAARIVAADVDNARTASPLYVRASAPEEAKRD